MDVFQLRNFISAATLGNFSAAAKENNVSQSSFSKQIMSLERELGVTLFSRKHRKIMLTPAGEAFLEHAYEMINAYTKMRGDMSKFVTNDRDTISVATIPVMTQYHIIDQLIAFRKLHNRIALSLVEAESTQVLNALRKAECDFAILRTDFLDPAQLNIKPLVRDRLVAIMSVDHPLAKYEEISLGALKDEPLTIATKQSDLHKIAYDACLKAGFCPNVGMTVSGKPDITLGIVGRNEAICLAMERVMDYYVDERCKIVPLQEEINSVTALVWLKSAKLRPACQMLRDYLVMNMKL